MKFFQVCGVSFRMIPLILRPREAQWACLVLPIISLVAPWAQAQPDLRALEARTIELVPSDRSPPAYAEVHITIEGHKRVIVANGLPDHATGRFPNRSNPNSIRAQRYRFEVPLSPVAAAQPRPLGRQPFGVALNGVPFDPGTAETWKGDRRSGWSYEALGGAFSLGLDSNHAHVQPTGAYHYHGLPTDLLIRLSGGKPGMTLVGWAADGFPIYALWGPANANDPASEVIALRSSYRLKSGARPASGGQPGGSYNGIFVQDYEYVPGSGDLDECGGRTGVTPEYPHGTYYYVLTEDYPFVPRYFRGTPDPSFARGPGPGAGRGGPPAEGREGRPGGPSGA